MSLLCLLLFAISDIAQVWPWGHETGIKESGIYSPPVQVFCRDEIDKNVIIIITLFAISDIAEVWPWTEGAQGIRLMLRKAPFVVPPT